MKRSLMFLLLTMLAAGLPAQEITGKWYGLLEVGGSAMRIVWNIDKADGVYTATMDSPDQGAKGIPVDIVTFEAPNLVLKISQMRIEYTGELVDSIFKGTFKQAIFSAAMDLTQEEIAKPTPRRKQDPKKPYPYIAEDVSFPGKEAGITLAGTLTIPPKPGKYPAVVLISGSGPQNRDEELLNHRPFLVLSDYLTRRGIAVLRYDDRGTAESTGDFSTATTADFATDASAAIEYLKTRPEIDHSKMGLMGHSEGGVIAPMVANRNQDVAYIVLLAGTGIPGDELMLMQMELIGRAEGLTEEQISRTWQQNRTIFDMVKRINDQDALTPEIETYLRKAIVENPDMEIPEGMNAEELVTLTISQFTGPWMQYFLKHDPAKELEKVKVPVLAVNGTNDLQVPAKVNLEAIEKAVRKGGNSNVTVKEYKKLNHLFQKSKTGHPDEYGEIEQTFSPKVMKDITKWILRVP
ncbi:MAG: alpha/beta fold hydrolase [Bacteroidales bacterium]